MMWLRRVFVAVLCATALTVLVFPPLYTDVLVNLANVGALKACFGSSAADWNAGSTALALAAMERAPERRDWQMRVAETFVYQGEWVQANAWYARLRASGGNTVRAIERLKALAILRHWCGPEDAELLRAVEELSDTVTAYRTNGDICMAQHRYDAAAAAYQQAFGRRPEYEMARPLVWALLQRAEGEGNNLSDASMRCYREIVEILERVPPTGAAATLGHYALAVSYWRMNSFDRALAEYKACVNTGEESDVSAVTCNMHLGYAYADWLPAPRRDPSLAAGYFERALVMAHAGRSNTEEAELALGKVYLRLHRNDQARDHLRKAVGLGHGDATAAQAQEVLDRQSW
jgi:tetratricopeptide (TPR) repeat protein